jgi:2-dehydro-3-deoxyphosphogluconate aldolase/(4S)-4-hydroxy-2-oxoglutarate aldolase
MTEALVGFEGDHQLAAMLELVPLIGVLRRCPPEHAVIVARAAFDAGVRVLEVTMDSDRAAWQLGAVCEALGDGAVVGAGTVTSSVDVAEACQSGAAFLIAPNCDPAVVEAAHDRGVRMVPGVMTPTELLAARRAGATLAKLFPAGPFGPSFVSTLREPIPDVQLIVTGGIGLQELRPFLDAGAFAVGIGGVLFPSRALRECDTAFIGEAARQLVEVATSPGVCHSPPATLGGER